jgi:diguanylate cyclase (GGDEF)-like protein
VPGGSKLHWIETFKTPIIDENGNVLGTTGFACDITERKKSEELIHQLAYYDALTQLPNRRLLKDRLGQAMAASARSGRYGALMFLDLDNFKPLNDTHGHEVGDLLLIEVARRITDGVREMDTVARFGGDEFVVMLSELHVDIAEATALANMVAEKIHSALADPYVLSVQRDGKADATVEHHCTASIGVVLFINHEATEEDILKWADLAMYQAKDEGRNLIRFYN